MMDGPDIGNTPNFQTGVDYTPPSVEENAPVTAPSPGQVEYEQADSTISKSEAEILAALFVAMQFPTLTPPNMMIMQEDGGSGAEAIGALSDAAILKMQMAYEETKNDIITSMWDKFSQSVKELAELAKKDDIKKWTLDITRDGPKSGTEYLAYLIALSGGRRDEELGKDGDLGQSALSVQFNQSFNQWFTVPGAETAKVDGVNGRYPDPSFIAGTLASNPDTIRDAIGAVGAAIGFQLSTSPVADALAAVGPSSGLPMDAQASAAMIAALLYGGARNQADVETLEKTAKSGAPPLDKDFALSFAKNILAIVSHNIEGEASVNKDQNQMVRLMLTVIALNLLYRATFGGMEGKKEFMDLLEDGGTADIDPSVKPMIDQLIAHIKKFLPKNEPERSTTLAHLGEYIDSKDSVESMLSTTRMFAASLKARPDIFGGRLGATSA